MTIAWYTAALIIKLLFTYSSLIMTICSVHYKESKLFQSKYPVDEDNWITIGTNKY